MRSTFTTSFFLKRSVVLKDGTCRIMGRITVSGKIADFSTKLKIHPGKWDAAANKASGKSADAINTNAVLVMIEKAISDVSKDLLIKKGDFTAKQLKDLYIEMTRTAEEKEKLKREKLEKERREAEERERQETGVYLKPYFQKYIKHREKEVFAGELTQKTFSRYVSCCERLTDFMKENYQIEDIPLKKVDIFFIREFEMYIRTNVKCNNNTAMKIVQKLCTVVTLAHDTGEIPLNPFKLYKFKFEETERERLKLDELWNLYNYPFSSAKLERVRDVYVFSCYTGLAFTDVQHLMPDHIICDNSGEYWIRKIREKTNNMCDIPLLGIPLSIIEKYKTHPICERKGVVLPVSSNQKMNSYLSEIADICGIRKNLTTHTARHIILYFRLKTS